MPAPDVFVLTESELERVCQKDEYLSVPPVLAVEILSPGNRKSRIAEKVQIYLSGGVPSVWVVSPKKKTVTVHTQSEMTLYAELAKILLPAPLAGVLRVADFFRIKRAT